MTSRAPARRLLPVLALCLVALPIAVAEPGTTGGGGAPVVPAPTHVIVKYRSDGPAALDRCAEALSRSGAPFASATRDGSASLDRLRQRLRLGPDRALFGTRPGETLEGRRARLATRARGASPTRRGEAPGRRDPARLEAIAGRWADLAHVYRVEIAEGASATRVAGELAADPHVEYAQPDRANALDQALFDDPFLSSSGSWGQPYADLWGLERIGAAEAWSRSQGEGIVVAVVDSGLDTAHPDIADNLWVHPGEDLNGDGRAGPEDRNGVDDDGNGFVDDLVGFDFVHSVDADGDGFYDGPQDVSDADPFDDRGHGTHVAGTIAAVADNGIGIAGVAPRARIMALKGFAAEGSAADSVLWRAVLYAAENGADIVNNSWSCGVPCPDNPLAEDVLEAVEALGVVVVTSAGNASSDVVYNSPEKGRRVITVGSIGFDDRISSFSNRGWLLDGVAPGGGPPSSPGVFIARRNILSLLSSGTLAQELAFAVAGDYYRLAGTSMSTPHVAGAVALLLSLRPELEPGDVRRLVRMSARDAGESGRDPIFGPGVLDLPSLLDAPLPELDLAITSPRPGATHDPADGPLVVRGRAEGAAIASVEIEVGAGLAARVFRPLEDVGGGALPVEPSPDEETDEGILARWDVSRTPTGPYVIRLRARLVDGRIAEEATVVGIERIRPRPVSDGRAIATAPALAGPWVFWQQADVTGDGFAQDLFGARFPSPSPSPSPPPGASRAAPPLEAPSIVPVVEAAGDQRGVEAGGPDLVWRSIVEGEPRLERCRWAAERAGCRVEVVVEGDETPTVYRVGMGRLVWMGPRDGALVPLGCRLDGVGGGCDPKPLLVATARPGWTIQSFDGRSLLLSRGLSEHALCVLASDGAPCVPEPFELVTSPFVSTFRPTHDGLVVAYEEVATRPVTPPECEAGEGGSACAPRFVLATRYHVCRIDEVTRRCEGVAVSDSVALDDAEGSAVSGHRVVWSVGSSISGAAIHVCEFDPVLRECLDQRLTGHVAAAGKARLEDGRIVWEDARSGPGAIWGFELPSLRVPRSVRAARDGRFTIPVFGSAGSGQRLRFELARTTNGEAEAVDADFRAFGGAPRSTGEEGLLIGSLPEPVAEVERLRVRAFSDDGLFTQETLELRIPTRSHPASGSAGPPGTPRGAGEAPR